MWKYIRLPFERHTIKPGTLEHGITKHGTPAEQQNTEHRRNSGTPWNNGIPAEYKIEKEKQYKEKN